MSRIGLLNMILGFSFIFFAACAGSFIGFDMTEGFLKDKAILDSWELALQKSAHGHTNLFGMTHVLFGLTIPYSKFSEKIKMWQTIGLLMGSLAMSFGMIWRSWAGPVPSLDITGIVVGAGLSAALIMLGSHCLGLFLKFQNRAI